VKVGYLHLYTGDWLTDPALSLCSPATRGVWVDLICYMHRSNQGGKLIATREQLTRYARCSDIALDMAIYELQTTRTADIYERNGIVTVICRRLKREAELIAKRKQAGSKGGSKTQASREPTPFVREEKERSKEREENVPVLPFSVPVLTEEEREEQRVHSALDRVRAFAAENGISINDADWFFWKGQGNGWTNDGKPIQDWKATLRSWRNGGYLPSQKQKIGNGTPRKPMLSFADRAKRKAEIQQQLNDQFRTKEGAFTDQEKAERERLRKEMEEL